jgi:hypothetical protein
MKSHSSVAAGLQFILVVIVVGVCVLAAAKGLIDLTYMLVGASGLGWVPFFEVGVTVPIILFLLKRSDWLRTLALVLALAGLGGFVKIGVELNRAYSIGLPWFHSPAQYYELAMLYVLFVLSFFIWYFWDKGRARKRRLRPKRRRSSYRF